MRALEETARKSGMRRSGSGSGSGVVGRRRSRGPAQCAGCGAPRALLPFPPPLLRPALLARIQLKCWPCDAVSLRLPHTPAALSSLKLSPSEPILSPAEETPPLVLQPIKLIDGVVRCAAVEGYPPRMGLSLLPIPLGRACVSPTARIAAPFCPPPPFFSPPGFPGASL